MNGSVLHLQIVTADTGKPIPNVPIDYFAWGWRTDPNGAKLRALWQKRFLSNRLGVCDVIYPENIDRLELITGKGPFADTRLLWQRPLGDVIPTNYVLRVERAVAISGTVVDAEGNGVPGAIVTLKLSAPDTAEPKPPQNNEYYGTTFEATTDQAGRWQINRVAGAIIPYLVGDAKESNYVDSDSIFTSRDKSAEQQLRDGTFVFKLGHPVTAEGISQQYSR
jgi:hypothetical protein